MLKSQYFHKDFDPNFFSNNNNDEYNIKMKKLEDRVDDIGDQDILNYF